MSEEFSAETPILDGWKIVLGPGEDGEFEAVKTAPQWAFLRLNEAAKSKDQQAIASATMKLSLALVVRAERDRLDTYLGDHEEEGAFDRLSGAIEPLTERWTNRPLAKPSTSGQDSQIPEQPLVSRVVSLEAGTVVESGEPAPSAKKSSAKTTKRTKSSSGQ